MRLQDIKPNSANPRIIKDASFEKLCNSIRDFPKMMALRPIVTDAFGMVLGGNMRLKALQHLGFKEVPDDWVRKADELTEDEKRRFIIADNVSGGEWDVEDLAANWDREELDEWGIEVDWGLSIEPDYEDLIGEEKNKPAILKITFENPEELQKAEIDIQELIDRKYPNAYFSVSAGEI